MNKGEHDKICKAGNRGKMRNVEHQNTHQRGTVLLCSEDGFDLSADGEKSHWATQNTELKKSNQVDG